MISFRNDYGTGADSRVLDALIAANNIYHDGYGLDSHSKRAADLIRKVFGCPDADVHFMTGGTQTNAVALGAFLRPHHAVVTTSEGHIHVHEAGSIEATGHKLITFESYDAKLLPEHIAIAVAKHIDEHMVKPRLAYISNSTELGSIYKKDELYALAESCRKHGLHLFMDGARLGSALSSDSCDLKSEDLAACLDAFYIGGTKNGMLFGEALVIVNNELKEDFRYIMKQRGAMLAKGYILGVQFEAVFEDGLYFELAKRANGMAKRLSDGIARLGLEFMLPPESNQIFPIIPDKSIEALSKKYGFYVWKQFSGGKSAIRLVCSCATKVEETDAFLADLSYSLG